MKHVLVQALTEDLPQVSLALAKVGVFALDVRSVAADKFPIVPGNRYRELFAQAVSRMDKIGRMLPMPPPVSKLGAVRVVDETELDRLNSWLGDIWAAASSYEERFHLLTEQDRTVDQKEASLENFANLNVDLSLLQGNKQFLNLFVGTVPKDDVQRLEEAVNLSGNILRTFFTSHDTANIVVMGLKGSDENALTSVLQTAGFRPLLIPPELHSQPETIRKEIQDRRESLARERQETRDKLDNWAKSLASELESAHRVLVMAEPFVRMQASMRSTGGLGAVTGWVPAEEVGKIETTLEQRLTSPFVLTVRDPTKKEDRAVPTLLQTNKFMAPFQDLICQYGFPGYGEADPTPLFAPTFILMFGAMFGDIGQGGIIALAGWLLRNKLSRHAGFIMALGISSVIFGFLYGSIFGYEHVIAHWWVAPMTDPPYMLTIALLYGAAFVTAASLISVYNNIAHGHHLHAMLGNHGIASLVFYLSTVGGLFSLVQTGEFGMLPSVLAMGAMIAMFAYVCYESDGPVGERVIVGVIESMELLLGYMSNTLSFLRVAAFSLNHAALAMAVFAIAVMMQTTGYWVSVVFGNIFILVLEGAVVFIQTLRLEYYEGFSRYYSGDGYEYQPIQLSVKTVE